MVKAHWNTEELVENWTLVPQELELVNKKVGANQIGFAIFLKYFQLMARFPDSPTAYRQRVHTVVRNSFASHYRRMIPQLLEALEFCSNNDIHRPVIQALEILKKYAHSKARYYDSSE